MIIMEEKSDDDTEDAFDDQMSSDSNGQNLKELVPFTLAS